MARVIGGGPAAGPGPLVIEVSCTATPGSASTAGEPARARVRIAVADADLAGRLEDAIAARLEAAHAATGAAPRPRVVRIASPAVLARRGAEVAGAVVLVNVTRRNVRAFPRLVAALEAAGALGVQLIWDGRRPPREFAEAPVFAVLEERRGRAGAMPVVVAGVRECVEALRRATSSARSAPP